MSNQRKSTWDSLTSEQEEFLVAATLPRVPPAAPRLAKRPDADTSSLKPGVDVQAIEPPKAKPSGSTKRNAAVSRPFAARTISVRLHPETALALRKACATRGVEYLAPYSQQAIVEQALVDWLGSNGFPVGNT